MNGAVALIVIEVLIYVARMANRDSRLADLAGRHRSVRVVAVLGRQIESDRESALALLEVIEEASIRLLRVAETGIGADNPGLSILLRRFAILRRFPLRLGRIEGRHRGL
jgi:hypothetical protein